MTEQDYQFLSENFILSEDYLEVLCRMTQEDREKELEDMLQSVKRG